MTITATTTAAKTPVRTATLWRAGSAAAVAAGGVTLAVAAGARAAGVPLDAPVGQPIPLLAFPQLTIIATLLGTVLAVVLAARAARPRMVFVRTTVGLVAVSLVPDVLVGTDAGSVLVLMLAHLLAAAIVIPVLATRLAR